VSRGLSRAEAAELARSLSLVLERIQAGELTAPVGTVYRLEGAVVALRRVLGERPDDLLEELLRDRR